MPIILIIIMMSIILSPCPLVFRLVSFSAVLEPSYTGQDGGKGLKASKKICFYLLCLE